MAGGLPTKKPSVFHQQSRSNGVQVCRTTVTRATCPLGPNSGLLTLELGKNPLFLNAEFERFCKVREGIIKNLHSRLASSLITFWNRGLNQVYFAAITQGHNQIEREGAAFVVSYVPM